MSSREEWCADKLSKLLQEDLRITTLQEIKAYLETVPQDEASRTAHLLNLPPVFDCLNDSNKDNVDLACEVLSICMNSLDIGESTNKYNVPLERALGHPYSAVKLMALKEIGRNIEREDALLELCKRPSLFYCVLRCVGDEDIEVAKKASDIITAAGMSPFGLEMLLSRDTLRVLNDIKKINEIVRLRVYEILVNIAKESEVNFNKLKGEKLLDQILQELNSEDILFKMNIVELLTQLGMKSEGLSYLEKNEVLNNLISILENEDDTVTFQLCAPGILKFFGHLACQEPQLLMWYPKIFDIIFANIEKSDLGIVTVALDTLGVVGLSNEGKTMLVSTENKITYAIKTITRLLSSLPMDVKLRALNCIENLLRVKVKSNEIMQITRKWYKLMCDDPMEVILRYAKNPFVEIKLAGLGILQAMAEQQWGQEEIKNTPGLIEFLLDRSMEVTKETKEMKYKIVKELANSTTFDSNTIDKLQKFVKEGAFFVQPEMEVEFVGED